uniref:Uncharacterized protein n=1 Tax=Trypanosoma vivax (strain Y486) TaxID=1055687 RepID=G0UB51_TRYVY|nr:conserved hypothetical protein, fragment [Trypanosoma vivax Y486]
MGSSVRGVPAYTFHVRTLLLMALFTTGSLTLISSLLSKTTTVTRVADEKCVGMRPVDQVIVLLVDALRPDFVLKNLSPHYLNGEKCSASGSKDVGSHRRTLTYIEDSLKNSSQSSHGFFFLADTPTITAQRIKAMTTGTTPAFLEVGTNLNTDEVAIDNVLLHLRRRSILLGDDTWLNLYPAGNVSNATVWKHTHALSPYNVSDFDTNDAAVLEQLQPLLVSETMERSPDTYAKLIIGHLLAVDHVGHHHQADHPAMYRKLGDIDEALRNVSHWLRSRHTAMRTLLLVFGDHGMTNSGDHGGDSEGERDSFLYTELFEGNSVPVKDGASSTSLQESFKLKAELTEMRWREKAHEDLVRFTPCRDAAGVNPDKLSSAHQVDLTPTLAVLLGVPIPFSNIGQIVPEIIALVDPTADINALEECNWRQIVAYFSEAGLELKSRWHNASIPLRMRLGEISNFARSLRMEVRRDGAFIGSFLCMIAAFSFLWNLFAFRVCAPFANSFIIKESVEVFCLLQLLLVSAALSVPKHQNSSSIRAILAFVIIGMRLMVPLLCRERSHITHTAEAMPPLEQWIMMNFPDFHYATLGLAVGAVVFGCVTPCTSHRLLTVTLALVMMYWYRQPVLHHMGPLALFAMSMCVRRGAPLRYISLVLWSASLCSDNYIASASIAVGGAILPSVIAAIQHMPAISQAVMLHLFTWVSFFAQGNHCLLNTVDLNASFVGMPFNNVVLGIVFVLSRVCNAFLLAPVAVMLTYTDKRSRGWRVCYLFLFLAVVQSSISNLNSYIQKSHLMFFPIFCPKFMFDFCICCASAVGYLLACIVV